MMYYVDTKSNLVLASSDGAPVAPGTTFITEQLGAEAHDSELTSAVWGADGKLRATADSSVAFDTSGGIHFGKSRAASVSHQLLGCYSVLL